MYVIIIKAKLSIYFLAFLFKDFPDIKDFHSIQFETEVFMTVVPLFNCSPWEYFICGMFLFNKGLQSII